MTTDDLIDQLVVDVTRPSPRVGQLLALLLPLAFAGVLLSVVLGPRIRPDFWDILQSWRYLAKFGTAGSIGLMGLLGVLQMVRPQQASRQALFWLFVALAPSWGSSLPRSSSCRERPGAPELLASLPPPASR